MAQIKNFKSIYEISLCLDDCGHRFKLCTKYRFMSPLNENLLATAIWAASDLKFADFNLESCSELAERLRFGCWCIVVIRLFKNLHPLLPYLLGARLRRMLKLRCLQHPLSPEYYLKMGVDFKKMPDFQYTWTQSAFIKNRSQLYHLQKNVWQRMVFIFCKYIINICEIPWPIPASPVGQWK